MSSIKVLLVENKLNADPAFEQAINARPNLELLATVYDGYKAVEFVKNNKVDLMLMDVMIPGLDGIAVLREIKETVTQPPVTVLVTALSSELIINQAAKLGAVHVFLKPFEADQLVTRTLEVYHDAHEASLKLGERLVLVSDVRRMIVILLHEIGMPPQLLGYQYLRTAIFKSVAQNGFQHGITTTLYPQVASEHNSTPQKIERSIRHAIEATWNRGDVETLHRIFGYTVARQSGRPTNSEFIARMTDIVLMRCSSIS